MFCAVRIVLYFKTTRRVPKCLPHLFDRDSLAGCDMVVPPCWDLFLVLYIKGELILGPLVLLGARLSHWRTDVVGCGRTPTSWDRVIHSQLFG